MAYHDSDNFKALQKMIADTGNTCAFDGKGAVACMKALLAVIGDMGLNPMKTDELREGLFTLFNIEVLHTPDLYSRRYILAPNHVSDFDALILGVLHPHIRIVSKSDWTANEKLGQFLNVHYDLYGLDRTSLSSLRNLLIDTVHYFNDSDENKHFLLFSQGTISDFNNNSPERISTFAHKTSRKTGIPIMNMFVEQVSLSAPTRIVFGEPFTPSKEDNFRDIWLQNQIALQNSLSPAARRPILTPKHSQNNKPGDPFF